MRTYNADAMPMITYDQSNEASPSNVILALEKMYMVLIYKFRRAGDFIRLGKYVVLHTPEPDLSHLELGSPERSLEEDRFKWTCEWDEEDNSEMVEKRVQIYACVLGQISEEARVKMARDPAYASLALEHNDPLALVSLARRVLHSTRIEDVSLACVDESNYYMFKQKPGMKVYAYYSEFVARAAYFDIHKIEKLGDKEKALRFISRLDSTRFAELQAKLKWNANMAMSLTLHGAFVMAHDAELEEKEKRSRRVRSLAAHRNGRKVTLAEKVEYSYVCFHEENSVTSGDTVGIDSMSTDSIFGSKHLLENIRPCSPLTFHGIAGSILVTQVGTHRDFGDVYFYDGVPNVLSLACVEDDDSINISYDDGVFKLYTGTRVYSFPRALGRTVFTCDMSIDMEESVHGLTHEMLIAGDHMNDSDVAPHDFEGLSNGEFEDSNTFESLLVKRMDFVADDDLRAVKKSKRIAEGLESDGL